MTPQLFAEQCAALVFSKRKEAAARSNKKKADAHAVKHGHAQEARRVAERNLDVSERASEAARQRLQDKKIRDNQEMVRLIISATKIASSPVVHLP